MAEALELERKTKRLGLRRTPVITNLELALFGSPRPGGTVAWLIAESVRHGPTLTYLGTLSGGWSFQYTHQEPVCPMKASIRRRDITAAKAKKLTNWLVFSRNRACSSPLSATSPRANKNAVA